MKNRLRKIIQNCYRKTGGYIENDVLFTKGQEISLTPFLDIFEKVKTSRLFTRLPPLFDENENFPISDMYVELSVAQSQGFADPLRLNRGLSLAEEQEERNKQRQSRRLNIEQCVENPEYHNIVILGDPGSGKTSLLKYLCQHIARNKSKRWTIPLFISLRQYWSEKQALGSSHTLLRFAAAVLQSQMYGHGTPMLLGLSKESEVYRKGLLEIIAIEDVLLHITGAKQGHILFMLDGLDEVASQPDVINSISEEIRQLGTKFSWLLSSRYTGFYSGLGEDICYEVVSLHQQGMEQLVANWFNHTDPQLASQKSQLILSQIHSNPRLRDMARNPFLLILLCYVQNYNQKQSLPVQRSDIYAEIIKLIRQQLRSIKRNEQLLRKTELDYLAKFCHYLYTDVSGAPLQLFEYDHWDACASPYSSPDFDKHFLSSRLMNSWKQNGDFHFVHLTFQEYFIAVHLSMQPAEQVKTHLYNPQWRMVYRFLSGLYGKLQNKQNYRDLLNGLLDPADKMGLLYIEAAWFLIEAGVENSSEILTYDLRDKLWEIWGRNYSYAAKSAGEALAILSPSYVIRKVIELYSDAVNTKLARKSIALLGHVNSVDANDLLLEFLQSKEKKHHHQVIKAIAEKNTPEIRSQCIDVFKTNHKLFYADLCGIAKESKHKDFLPYLLLCVEDKPSDLGEYSALFKALTAIAAPDSDQYLLALISQYALDELSDEILEAFMSLGTELVTTWLNDTLSLSLNTDVKQKIIFHAIRYALLSTRKTIEALKSDDIHLSSQSIMAVYDQKKLGLHPSVLIIHTIAKIAFSDSDNSSKAFSVLVFLDRQNIDLNKNSVYKTEYRRFLKDKNQKKVINAVSILAENKDMLSFATILEFANSSHIMDIKIEAITALPQYYDLYSSKVKKTLHTIYRTNKQNKDAMSSDCASEALRSLAKISIKELIPYYSDAEAQEVLTQFCAIEGILLFDGYYIDRYGAKNTLATPPNPSIQSFDNLDFNKLDPDINAIEQLCTLRKLCLYLLANNYAKKSGNKRKKPIPLFNRHSETNESVDSIDIKTGNTFLSGKELTELTAPRLMNWIYRQFPWAFIKP